MSVDRRDEANNLRIGIAYYQRELAKEQEKLAELELRCDHNWKRFDYFPLVADGQTIALRWQRSCHNCGKTEITDQPPRSPLISRCP